MVYYINFVVLLFLQYLVTQSTAILQIKAPETPFVLRSKDLDQHYPPSVGDGPIDVVWEFFSSIKLDINYFALDGQSGDFLMISDVPLFYDHLLEGEQLEGLEPDDDKFIDAILITNGLLLSWSVNQTIQVHNSNGAFIYFHAEVPKMERNSSLNWGFEITVNNFDTLRTTTTPSPPETTAPTPAPGTEIYLSIFLSCINPQELARDKEDFKVRLANMATLYCEENQDLNCGVDEFNATEVNIPDREGIYSCDPKWTDVNYETCVEVRFAIVRITNGTYIMIKERLKEMWDVKKDMMKEYCPFTPPDGDQIDVWIWIAFVLGIVLLFSSLLCIVWVKKSNEEYYKRSSSTRVSTSENEIIVSTGFFDHGNPIYEIIRKLQNKGKEDATYREMVNELGTMVDGDAPTVVKENKLFKLREGYDNIGFPLEELEVEFEYSKPKSPANTFSQTDFMNITELDNENSDTEI